MTTPLPVNDPARKALEEQSEIMDALDTALAEKKPEPAPEKVVRIEKEFAEEFKALTDEFNAAQDRGDENGVREAVGNMAELARTETVMYADEVKDAQDYLQAALDEAGTPPETVEEARDALARWTDAQTRFLKWEAANRDARVFDADYVVETMRAWKAQQSGASVGEPSEVSSVPVTEVGTTEPVLTETESAAPVTDEGAPAPLHTVEYKYPQPAWSEYNKVQQKWAALMEAGKQEEAERLWRKTIDTYQEFFAKDEAAFKDRLAKASRAAARSASSKQETGRPLKTLEDELASLDRAYAMGKIGREQYNRDKKAYTDSIRLRDAATPAKAEVVTPAPVETPPPPVSIPEQDAERKERIKAMTARLSQLKQQVVDMDKALKVAAVLKAKGLA